MAIPFYAGIALGHIGRHSQRRHGLCRPLISLSFVGIDDGKIKSSKKISSCLICKGNSSMVIIFL